MAHSSRTLASPTFQLQIREPPKIPISHSRYNTLRGNAVHIVPVAVALYLIIINLSGCYVGEHLGRVSNDEASDSVLLAFIQVFAKAEEWKQFTTHFWLNGTTEDFWPARLSTRQLAPNKQCRAGEPGSVCVSTGLPMLATYLAYSKNDDGGFAIYTPEQNFPRRIEGAPEVEGINAEALALVMTNLWRDPHWYPSKGKPSGQQTGTVEAEASAFRTAGGEFRQNRAGWKPPRAIPPVSTLAIRPTRSTRMGPLIRLQLQEH
ncbi:MAG: hypothetical protein Q9222_003100 [Ikaeria aurantiellina]